MSIAQKIELLGCDVVIDAPMSEYTSFRTGGKADVLVSPKTERELAQVLKICSEEKVTPFVFGNASNLLVSDAGVRGVCVRLSSNFEHISLVDETTVFCTAGTKLAHLCRFALEHSLTGLEFAYGIPGSAGGAAYMNAGAYGGEMKDILVSCTFLNSSGEFGRLTGDELDLSYRHSAFAQNGLVITRVTVRLEKGKKAEISSKMQELLNKRVEKQPLDLPSAGSYFKRPEGHYAGELIERCGLKGFGVGGAQVSEKHAGFIVNRGEATTADILELERLVRQKVYMETGVKLEREVKYIY